MKLKNVLRVLKKILKDHNIPKYEENKHNLKNLLIDWKTVDTNIDTPKTLKSIIKDVKRTGKCWYKFSYTINLNHKTAERRSFIIIDIEEESNEFGMFIPVLIDEKTKTYDMHWICIKEIKR